jgi:hypothetical protein
VPRTCRSLRQQWRQSSSRLWTTHHRSSRALMRATSGHSADAIQSHKVERDRRTPLWATIPLPGAAAGNWRPWTSPGGPADPGRATPSRSTRRPMDRRSCARARSIAFEVLSGIRGSPLIGIEQQAPTWVPLGPGSLPRSCFLSQRVPRSAAGPLVRQPLHQPPTAPSSASLPA